MKSIFLIFLTIVTLPVFSQTDNDIVDHLMGIAYSLAGPELETMGLYYHINDDRDINHAGDGKVNITIAGANKNAKLYILGVEDGIIEKITVNFDHSSMEDMMDLEALKNYDSKHVGKFSTDVMFIGKDLKDKILPTEKFYDLKTAQAFVKKSKTPGVKIYEYNGIYTVGIYHHEDESFIYFTDGKYLAKDKAKEIGPEKEE